jgi:hypothetical protein
MQYGKCGLLFVADINFMLVTAETIGCSYPRSTLYFYGGPHPKMITPLLQEMETVQTSLSKIYLLHCSKKKTVMEKTGTL